MEAKYRCLFGALLFSDIIKFKKKQQVLSKFFRYDCFFAFTFSKFIWFSTEKQYTKHLQRMYFRTNIDDCFCSARKKSKYEDLILHNYSLVKLWHNSWTYVRPEPFNNYVEENLNKRSSYFIKYFISLRTGIDNRWV